MEDQISQLQNLKVKQLIKLRRYPALNLDDIRHKAEELSKSDAANTIDSLRVLDCPRKRLLCKLAFDVTEQSKELEKVSTESLKQQIRKRYILNGDRFLLEKVPVNPLLKALYGELAEECLSLEREKTADKMLDLNKKFAYNVKYEPFCARCKEGIGLSSQSRNHMSTDRRQKAATLSFSISYKGYCTRVIIETVCQMCYNLSDNPRTEFKNVRDFGDLRIVTDPCIGNLDRETSRLSKKPSVTIVEIIKEIWSSIDTIVDGKYSRK